MWNRPPIMFVVADALYAIATVLFLYLMIFVLVHLPVFPVEHVMIRGQLKHTTREQIEYIVTRELKGNFFTIDLNAATLAFSKLPWVRQVKVKRRWSGQLEVMIEEHQPLARWGENGLVDREGHLFSASADHTLPLFLGRKGDEGIMTRNYLTFQQYLTPLNLEISELKLNPRQAWELKLKNGLVLSLGREQVEQRVSRFALVYNQTIKRLPRTVQYIDLRYPNGFAVRIADSATSPNPKLN